MNRVEMLKKGIDVGYDKYGIEKSKHTAMYMATIYSGYDKEGEPDVKSDIEERGNYCSVCLFLEDEPYNFGDVIEPSTYDADCDDCGKDSLPYSLQPIHVALTLGRHEIKTNGGDIVTDSVFPQDVPDLLDFAAHEKVVMDWIDTWTGATMLTTAEHTIYLYLTGATMLTTSFLNVWSKNVDSKCHNIILMHYNRDTGLYTEQRWLA